MAEATKKKSVRITLAADSGLSPPVYVLASFTSPPWKPHELMAEGARGQAYDDPSVVQVVYSFWGDFDVDPGVWTYKFRVGVTNWLLCDHRTERVIDSSGEELNILRVAGKRPAEVQSPPPFPKYHELPTSSSDSWRSSDESSGRSNTRSSFVTNPMSSSAHMAQERCNDSDTPNSDEEPNRLLCEASEVDTETRKSSDSRASVDSKANRGVFWACWQSLIAQIYGIFAKVFRNA